MMQILAVREADQMAVVINVEKAKRLAEHGGYALFELRFGKTPRPVLKPIEAEAKERKRTVTELSTAEGDPIE